MLSIITKEGHTKLMVAGDPTDIACDCIITAINSIRQYAEMTSQSEQKAAMEVIQEIMLFYSGAWEEGD